MTPGKDLQIILQAPEELKCNSFKNQCLVFSIRMFVCVWLAFLLTAEVFHISALLVLLSDLLQQHF